MRFQRLMRDAGLLDSKFAAADADLLFLQTLRSASGGAHEVDASSGANFHDFCDAVVEVARRKHALSDAPGAPLAATVQRVIEALPAAPSGPPVK